MAESLMNKTETNDSAQVMAMSTRVPSSKAPSLAEENGRDGQDGMHQFEVEKMERVDEDVQAAPPRASVMWQAAVFAFFAITRSAHYVMIDMSKEPVMVQGKEVRKITYIQMTPCFLESVLTILVAQSATLAAGGVRDWKAIWSPRPLIAFSLIGLLYSSGDFTEMLSMGSMSGSAYQVIMQSKFVVTALMVWAIKGVGQSILQWVLLVMLMSSMLVYSLMDNNKSDSQVPGMAYVVAVTKVALSCFGAVVADKYLKDFQSEPFCMQMVQLKLSQALLGLCLCLIAVKPDFKNWSLGIGEQTQGFFDGWDNKWVVFVMFSFTLKAWSTMYLVRVLDSVQKNLAEAVCVLLTYTMECSLDWWPDRAFEANKCLAVCALILAVVAYVVAKPVVDKARRYDAELACKPDTQLL